ncbi:MAG: hypothetical protein ACRD0W_10000 [Acidimicrobiales bacterium]
MDATGPTAGFTYQAAETSTARLTMTDTLAASNSTTVTIHAGGDVRLTGSWRDRPAAQRRW